ncbi:MAG: hypothetical protein AUK47_23620 [Deltaproteobacteria bacterium CG2_30_63_29]|nr:MAG: hypothetical protein AUK47_23620 [Deltaproteobacteria bacterium CG2_30_63_29]PJB38249.1 MAG: hypothetical protein CO108_19325 [Deltaproteobacteria bacterium CG_4_9_14_3_um_filter_63_12]
MTLFPVFARRSSSIVVSTVLDLLLAMLEPLGAHRHVAALPHGPERPKDSVVRHLLSEEQAASG